MKRVSATCQTVACAGVCRQGLKSLFAAFVAVLALCVGAKVITIPENGTFTMGGTGDDPNNKTSNYIVFEPGSTLVVTAINDTVSIWPTIIATNGAATVRCGEGDTDRTPTFQYHCFIRGEGSLTLRDMHEAFFGHSGHHPVVDLGNLYKGEGVGTVYLVKGASVLAFPTNISYMLTMDQTAAIRLCGKDMFPDKDVIEFDSNRCKIILCNPEAIPAGKTLRAKGDRIFVSPLAVPDPEDGIVDRYGSEANTTSVADGYVYNCNFELVNNSTLTFTNSKPITVNGTIAGSNGKCGNIALSGYRGTPAAVTLGSDNAGFKGKIYATRPGCELVLSNANAAVNATIDMSIPYAVRIAEGLSSTTIGFLSGGTDINNSIIYASPGQTVQVKSASGTVRACGTGIETALMPAKGTTATVAGDGSFAVDAVTVLYGAVSWWFDFSRADTRFRIGEGSTTDHLHREYATDQPFVERVVDWRYPNAVNCLWNRRLYNESGSVQSTAYPNVYPYVSSTRQNGLQYISMETSSSSRRLPFSNGSGFNTVASCEAQLVVMVFGVNSSCFAMFGTSEGAFGRAGLNTTYAMTTNDQHDVWLDGVKVNPTTTKFKSGLQVISVALDGLHFNGLGFISQISTSPNEMGGQNYGEVLIFTNAVSERVRLEAEQYLARKWGLDAQYSPTAVTQLKELRKANPVRITAAGCDSPTIKAGDHAVTVGGPFVGTVNLEGGTLVVSNMPLPYTESDIPSAGRLYWADPDDAETVMRFGDPFFSGENAGICSNELRAIKDKATRAFVEGQPALIALGERRPTPIRQSRGVGPERMWIDFNDYLDETFSGNCLRFLQYPSASDSTRMNSFKKGLNSNVMATMNVRTAFVVQDSVRGGGAPLLNNVGGATYPKNRSEWKWTQTIWPEDKPDELAGGENRLNGNVVDYTKGFLGRPEVFTVRATAAYDLPFIGCYLNTEGASRKNGEIIGEVLLYGTELSNDQVKGIEAYLMSKWIGLLPDGYADIRQATVAGTGTVQVAVGAQRPNIDRGFEGTVAIESGGDFTMTIDPDTGTVMGALDCPAATLSLPASCSITVNLTRRPPLGTPSRDYTLVDCASGADGVTWTFNFGANTTSRCRFVQTGNKMIFRYVRPGTSIMIR